MKLNLDYKDDPRWARMGDNHKNLNLPNLFIHILYEYQNQILNLINVDCTNLKFYNYIVTDCNCLETNF